MPPYYLSILRNLLRKKPDLCLTCFTKADELLSGFLNLIARLLGERRPRRLLRLGLNRLLMEKILSLRLYCWLTDKSEACPPTLLRSVYTLFGTTVFQGG
jgi:hypothetical protein